MQKTDTAAKEMFKFLLPDELREQIKHSESHCTLTGELWLNPFQQEDLFSVVAGMERYVVDNHSPWEMESKLEKNKNVAFIIGPTLETERENLKALLFGPKVDLTNNNLFWFGIKPINRLPMVFLSRIDRHLQNCFDPEKLEAESKPRSTRIAPQFQIRAQREKEAIAHEKTAILKILEVDSIRDLPLPKALVIKAERLLDFIKLHAPQARYKWQVSFEVARHCYAVLLMKDRRMRTEFAKPEQRNVFGDVVLIQNALFLGARILSNDRNVKRMAAFTNLPELECRKVV